MIDQREEARRQLEYIDAELARGDRTASDAKMLRERRAAIVEKTPRGEGS